ncbi:MAG: aspartate--tRNA(Asn) ligase [Candidatus Micrarchaeia archaeon]
MIRDHYISEITPNLDGTKVKIAGWVHEVRETSNITFLLLRDNTGIIQVIGKKGIVDQKIIKSMSLPKESIVEIYGTVKASKEAKTGCEIIPLEIKNLNPLSTKIPFEVTGKVPAELDVRLNYRYVDLRRAETAAIFKIQSTILNTFTTTLMNENYVQIRTPSIIAEASEGGAELFSVKYYEKNAYLAQSPQLYKQLAIIGGLDKVFMITPVFRAEKSNTVYHLSEITQMDIERAFVNVDDVIDTIIKVLKAIIKSVKENNQKELQTLNVDLEVPDIKIISYADAIKTLKNAGHSVDHGADITREYEKSLENKYGEGIVIKDFPTSLRAFYSMPHADNPELTHSFDLLYRGLEISSGAQRINDPEMLIAALKKKGLNPDNFKFYIDAFRSGAPPHAGWSIGLERLTMMITRADNIRECAMFPRDRKRITP